MERRPAPSVWADEGSPWSQAAHRPAPFVVWERPTSNPDQLSRHNAPPPRGVVISSPESLIGVLSRHLFSPPAAGGRLNPLHQIRAPLSGVSPPRCFSLCVLSIKRSIPHQYGRLLSARLFPEVASLPRRVLFVCSSVKEAELSSRQGWTAEGGAGTRGHGGGVPLSLKGTDPGSQDAGS